MFFMIVIFVIGFTIYSVLREKPSINKHIKNQNYKSKEHDNND